VTDFKVVHGLNVLLTHHDGWEDALVLYAGASEALFLVVLAAAFVFFPRARGTVVAAVASAGVALAIAAVIARIVDRPRPFVAHPGGVHLFAAHAADAGFPSDHATAAFAIAVSVLLASRRWGLLALAAATVLSVARVGMGIHYPSDVLAGAALGAAAALAVSRVDVPARVRSAVPLRR
jgi:undecaprenyl-diphosphatase